MTRPARKRKTRKPLKCWVYLSRKPPSGWPTPYVAIDARFFDEKHRREKRPLCVLMREVRRPERRGGGEAVKKWTDEEIAELRARFPESLCDAIRAAVEETRREPCAECDKELKNIHEAMDEARREEREACAGAVQLFQHSLKWSPIATDSEKEIVLGNLNGAIAAILARDKDYIGPCEHGVNGGCGKDKEPRDAER